MKSRKGETAPPPAPGRPGPGPERTGHGRLMAVPQGGRGLDPAQLHRLEQAFRQWVQDSPRADVRRSRRRILLIFLLIRYTGAKLQEVLALNPLRDLEVRRPSAVFGKSAPGSTRPPREVQLPETLLQELQAALKDLAAPEAPADFFKVDPGHVRRKFYERAAACGFPKELGGPDALRKSRAVELMQNQVPLPVVQKILGHSTPNLTASLVSFSDADIQRATRFFLDRESRRRTSARNSFFGKISAIRRGDIQTQVELGTIGGHRVTTVITNDSLARLGLQPGMLISAEVKAPWVWLQKGEPEPACSAENKFQGIVKRLIIGRVTTEYVVNLADGTELCSVVSSAGRRRLALHEGDPVWVMFNSFAVVLHLD
jgi:molybdate transport system regulatory protein